MRWMMLAVALVAASASPAFAQKVTFGSRTPTHRATYTSDSTPVKYAAHHTSGHGCATCDSGHHCASDCGHGHKHCCLPPLLPNLVDNVVDVFARFKPCPSRCAPCVRTVHCCPYPKTLPPTNCCKRRLPTLLDSIFACNKRCCHQSSGHCHTCNSGCTQPSCTTGEHTPYFEEIMTPPAPLPEMKESPFGDDPVQEEARRPAVNKTTGTPRSWYKTARRTPVYAHESVMPETIVVGNATPITVSE